MGYFICLEFGGTYIRSCIWDEQYEYPFSFQKRSFISGDTASNEINVNIINEIYRRLHNPSLNDLKGIGISSAAVFNRKDGSIIQWPNHILWNGFPLKEYIEHKFSIPVIMEDDGNCGAWGEYTYEKINSYQNMIYITVGTGVGCGLILNRELYIGDNGLAGELGHITNKNAGILCSCGNFDCLQSIVSGSAIVKRYNQSKKTNYIQLDQINALAKDNDEKAIQYITEAVDALALVIFNLLMILDINIVIIGGGVPIVLDQYITRIAEQVNKKLEVFSKSAKFQSANYGENSGLWGIGRLIQKKCINN